MRLGRFRVWRITETAIHLRMSLDSVASVGHSRNTETAPQQGETKMNAATRTRRNTLRAAATTSRALGYRTLSGIIGAHVEAGRLIKTGDFLDRVGGGDLKDGVKSWFGRHVAKAYRATTGTEPLRVWARHRTTGRWIHVNVFNPIDDALYTALDSYKATRHLLADMYARCA